MTIPHAGIGQIRHGKRDKNYTVMITADDLGEHHWMTRGMYMFDGETWRTPPITPADA
jgi:hypothetical protein